MTGRRGTRRKVVLRILLALAVLLAVAVGAAFWRVGQHDRDIERMTDAIPEEPGRPHENPGENWLLVGSDMRGEPTDDKWAPGEARADAVMLLHMPEDGQDAYVVSIPRDSYVPIPGGDDDKLSTALGKGGPRLLTQTVEQLSDVRVDHVAVVDFRGVVRMTDVLGGVRVRVNEDVVDPENGWSWSAGEHHMDGEEALRFVRERKGLPGGDTDRVKRQQAFVKAVVEKAASENVVGDPVRLDGFLRVASESIAVDDGVSLETLRGLAQRLSEAGPEGLVFVSVPVSATEWIGPKNVARLDEERTEELFGALRDDELDDYLAEQGLENEVDTVN